MATITNGTGGILQADTLENYIFLLACRIIDLQNNSTVNSRNLRGVNRLTRNELTSTIELGYDLPIIRTVNSSGQTVETADEYLTGLTTTQWQQATGGTIVNTGIIGAFKEALERLEILERDTSKNPLSLNNIQFQIDGDSNPRKMTGTLNLNFTPADILTSSRISGRGISITPYLSGAA